MAEKRIDAETLHAFIDGELTAPEQEATMTAIQEHPTAALDLASFSALKAATAKLPSPQLPDGAWKTCVRRLDEIDRTRRTESFVGKYAWGMCGAFLLLIVGAGGLNRLHPQSFDSNEMGHITSSLIPTATSSDTANVGKWLQGQVGSAPVPHLDRLTVIRAEVGVVDDHRVARVLLQDSTGVMTLIIVNGSQALDDLQPLANTNFHVLPLSNGSCLAWNASGYTLSLSGQRDPNSLARVATEIGNPPIQSPTGN
jgi:hypothetical protein